MSTFTLPAPEDRENGLEVLAFHRGRWRHVRWHAMHKAWSLGHAGLMIRDCHAFAPLPEKPEGAEGFFAHRGAA